MTYTPPDVGALVQETLDRANEVLPSDPARRVYIAHGEPPAPLEACDQLTAHLVRLRPKLLQDAQQTTRSSPIVAWLAEIALVRFHCVPVVADDEGNSFDADPQALTEAHEALTTDAVNVARHLSRLRGLGEWPQSVPGCGDIAWQPVEPLPPQGGQAAWRQLIQIQL